MDDDQKLEDVRKRLQKEKEIKAATMKLRDFQKSDAAKAACDATMEESQQRINYFQNEFDKLQLKKQQENSTKVARTHIPITLPSLENAPPMFKAGFESSRGGSYQSTSSSDNNNNSNSRMGSSRNSSSATSHYPEDFISSRPLSTVGKSISCFCVSKHLVVHLSAIFQLRRQGLGEVGDWIGVPFLLFIIRQGKAWKEGKERRGRGFVDIFSVSCPYCSCELN
jgi:hypothetical protein